MKKTIYGIALVGLIIVVTACGCKKEDAIVGKWKAIDSADYYYIFNADKTCAYEMAGARMECTYEDDGTKVTILYTGNSEGNTYEYKIEDNTLIIKNKDNPSNDFKYERN